MKLTDGEKLILLMLADMYKSLKIKGEFEPDFISETIHSDNLWGFNWHYSGIPFDDMTTPQVVTETVDVLDMWSLLEDSHKALSAADKAKIEAEAAPFGKHVKFPGFDGNNENHYGVAYYLVKHMGRFKSFKDRELNSHSPVIDSYLRMYEVFEPIRKRLSGENLTADEIVAILKARIHPDHR